jgi:uncharacterized membrane protein YphA (DoxX/SURF4 family)
MRQSPAAPSYETAVAVLRIILGVIILATWFENLNKGLYTAAGLTGFFNWLFDPQNGNGSSLSFYKAILDATVVPAAGAFAAFQMIAELIMGLALLLGVFSRFFGLTAMFFFANLLLSYFGGHEYIWTYVLLFTSALVVTLSHAGRKWGIDQWLWQQRGEPPFPVLW